MNGAKDPTVVSLAATSQVQDMGTRLNHCECALQRMYRITKKTAQGSSKAWVKACSHD